MISLNETQTRYDSLSLHLNQTEVLTQMENNCTAYINVKSHV
jgi:hypothetical protein